MGSTRHPEIPLEGMPDTPPLRIDRLEEVPSRNHAGELVFMADVRGVVSGREQPIKLILATNVWTGQIVRAAMLAVPGAGYVAIDPLGLPGNLTDIVSTIALEAGVSEQEERMKKSR